MTAAAATPTMAKPIRRDRGNSDFSRNAVDYRDAASGTIKRRKTLDEKRR
jgi:hypothetical protein